MTERIYVCLAEMVGGFLTPMTIRTVAMTVVGDTRIPMVAVRFMVLMEVGDIPILTEADHIMVMMGAGDTRIPTVAVRFMVLMEAGDILTPMEVVLFTVLMAIRHLVVQQKRKHRMIALASGIFLYPNPIHSGQCPSPLKFSIFNLGVDAEFGKTEDEPSELSSIEKVELLCDCLQEMCKHSSNKFYLLFDELQKAGSELEPSFGMQITKTLLMAIEQFHLDFCDYTESLIPIAFVREDTYRLIMYNDKDKWGDLIVNLSWTKYKIQNMLAYRISKTANPDGQLLSFDDAWRLLFPSTFINKANKPIFEDVYEHSFGRPRDFVMFIRESCRRAHDSGSIDLVRNWDSQILDFDNSSAESAIQEMNDLIPNFTKIQEAINQIGLTSFTYEELLKEYDPNPTPQVEEELKRELKILYSFMIIGMIINSGRKYVDSGTIFSVSKPLTIHKCFWPRLGLTHHIVSDKKYSTKRKWRKRF